MQLESSVRYGNLLAVDHQLEHINLREMPTQGAELLNIAAQSSYAGVEMLQLLVSYGANVNAVANPLDTTPLGSASKSGDLEKVRYLLNAGADVHFANRHRYTALLHAVYGQRSTRSEVVKLLLSAGANPNLASTYNESPLTTALRFCDFETIRILLQAGADLSVLDWNALMRAIALGGLDEVESELKLGADPNEQRKWGLTSWHLSLQRGDLRIVSKLLEYGAKEDRTDLFAAVEKDNPEIVEFLLSRGADCNAQNDYQATVLHYAAERNAAACVGLLISAGAKVDLEDFVHAQPLSLTSSPKVARMLVEAGADINFVSGEGYSLLKSAAGREDVELTRALLEMGADTEAEQKRYTTTALYVAVQVDHLEIVQMLLEAGANPNAQNSDGWFPLSNVQSVEMAKLLLDHGADIHLTDEINKDALQHQKDPIVAAFLIAAGASVNPTPGGSSPLREAANHHDLEMMRLLLLHGADVDQSMSWGETALMKAAEHSFVEGVALLLEQGANTELVTEEQRRTALFFAAAPEGFTAYDLMKKAEQRSWLDSVPEEQRALFEQIAKSENIEYRPTYGYVASDSVEAITLLNRAGADMNVRDAKGMTPLMLGALCGRPARVKALLQFEVETTLQDNEGKTALDHAFQHPDAEQRAEIIQLLSEAQKY